jgi:hypothetical protein
MEASLSRRKIDLVLVMIAVCAALAGCSDLYTDRRDTVAASAGDALFSNQVTQMVDPWPRASADRNIAFDGQRMQAAVQRYRENRVIEPVSAMTSSSGYGQAPQAAAPHP